MAAVIIKVGTIKKSHLHRHGVPNSFDTRYIDKDMLLKNYSNDRGNMQFVFKTMRGFFSSVSTS